MNELNINEEFLIFRHLPLHPFMYKLCSCTSKVTERSLRSSRLYQLWFLQYLCFGPYLLFTPSPTSFKCLSHLLHPYTNSHISETRSYELIQQIALFRDCPQSIKQLQHVKHRSNVLPDRLSSRSERIICTPKRLGCNFVRAMNSTQETFARYQWQEETKLHFYLPWVNLFSIFQRRLGRTKHDAVITQIELLLSHASYKANLRTRKGQHPDNLFILLFKNCNTMLHSLERHNIFHDN